MLIGPVGPVSLVKNCLVADCSHQNSVRNFRLKVIVSFPKKAHPITVNVLLLNIGRRHADGEVARVVLGLNEVLDDILPTHGAALRQICPYPGFDNLIESLHNNRCFIERIGKVLDIVAVNQLQEVRVDKFLTYVGVSAYGGVVSRF